jgi:hypothetical protein
MCSASRAWCPSRASSSLTDLIVMRAAMIAYRLSRIPLAIFSTKGLAGTRRERIEAVVVAGGKHARATRGLDRGGPARDDASAHDRAGWVRADGAVRAG